MVYHRWDMINGRQAMKNNISFVVIPVSENCRVMCGNLKSCPICGTEKRKYVQVYTSAGWDVARMENQEDGCRMGRWCSEAFEYKE